MILTANQAKNYLYNAGFRGGDLERAVKIGICESGLNTHARNLNLPREDSRGFMQINLVAHPTISMLDLYNPEINASVAYSIYMGANKTFTPWTCNSIIDSPVLDPILANKANLDQNNIFLLLGSIALLGGFYLFYSRT